LTVPAAWFARRPASAGPHHGPGDSWDGLPIRPTLNPHLPVALDRAGRPTGAIKSSQSSNRYSHNICRFVPLPDKNDAPEPTCQAGLSARQPRSASVSSGRRRCCNRVQPVRITAKWRSRPSEKRHFSCFSATFSTIFSEFFRELARECAMGRERDLEKEESRRVGLSCMAPMPWLP
jgi:hypothetical protein